MDFGKASFHPYPCAKSILVSKTLIRRSALSVDDIVRSRLAYKFAVTEENSFLNGSGNNEPLGAFVAHDQGISIARDRESSVSESFSADDILDLIYDLPAQYRQGAIWVASREFFRRARKLKDGQGQYLWAPGIGAAPATLGGYPTIESEYAPSTFSSGAYVALFGDWSRYWIVEALGFQVQVAVELYSETNQNLYIGRKEIDGNCIDQNGFIRLKCK
jgi:HK97 family phage major capsid protein